MIGMIHSPFDTYAPGKILCLTPAFLSGALVVIAQPLSSQFHLNVLLDGHRDAGKQGSIPLQFQEEASNHLPYGHGTPTTSFRVYFLEKVHKGTESLSQVTEMSNSDNLSS